MLSDDGVAHLRPIRSMASTRFLTSSKPDVPAIDRAARLLQNKEGLPASPFRTDTPLNVLKIYPAYAGNTITF